MRIVVMQTTWNRDTNAGFQKLLERAEKLLQSRPADFLLLPEFFYGPPFFQPGQQALKGVTDDTVPGKISDSFCSLAKRRKVNIIMGTMIERKGGEYRNVSLFIDRNGRIKSKTGKMHTFAGETIACKASEEIEVTDTEYGKIGIAVCSDFWIPEYMKLLVKKGAEIIFIPGGTLGQNTGPMTEALKTIAYLTSAVVVYASPVGEIEGKRGDKTVRLVYTGKSMIVTPEGIVCMASGGKDETLTADIAEDYIASYRNGPGRYLWRRTVSQNQKVMGEILTSYEKADRDLTAPMKERMRFDGQTGE